jgi:hypothetical protein
MSFSTGLGQAVCKDVNGVDHVVTFLSTAEEQTAWKAAWLGMVGLNTDLRPPSGDPPVDPGEFPGKFGTYEFVNMILAGLRS